MFLFFISSLFLGGGGQRQDSEVLCLQSTGGSRSSKLPRKSCHTSSFVLGQGTRYTSSKLKANGEGGHHGREQSIMQQAHLPGMQKKV